MTYKCNLCPQEFDESSMVKQQLTRHASWHLHCKRDKRNTVEGKVEWS
jgi:hypothetical protein